MSAVQQPSDIVDPVHRHVKIGTYWKKPPSVTYPSNFGFAVNGYQPMIDYLDAKDTGLTCSKKDIYLPFLEERCLDKYKAEKPFRKYTNVDIDNYIDKGDGIIRQIRQNDAIGIGSALTRTHTNWSMSKKWVQLVKKSHVIDYRKLREDRLEEEKRDALNNPPTNRRRGRSRQTCSRSPSISRSGSRGQVRSGTPVRTHSGRVDRIGRMAQTYEDALRTLSHGKLDHELLMTARRDRLDELDSQFEDVISNLASNLSRLNRSAKNVDVPPTVYDDAKTRQDVIDATDDQIIENKLRRRRELAALSEGVDELTRSNRSSSRSHMDYEIDDMNERLTNINQRQRDERLADLDALTALSHAAASYAARKKIDRSTHLSNIEDADVDYLTKRNSAVKENIIVEKPRKKHTSTEKLSDVHARVLNKAAEMTNMTSAARRINNRARFVNIYAPKPETGAPDQVVKPSRTELNIDNMAKSFVTRGQMTRRYDIDEEVDPPVSHLNTNARNEYRNMEEKRTIANVPSNSLRVRYAVIRARARNSILGY